MFYSLLTGLLFRNTIFIENLDKLRKDENR